MMTYFPVQVFKDVSDKADPIIFEHKEYSDREVQEILGLLELGDRKDIHEDFLKKFPEQKLKIAGFGGQGVLTAGVILAACAMDQNLHVSWIPSYGPEMRGGTANCSVILSNKRIGSPLTTSPNVLIAMNGPSLDAFEDTVTKGGLIIINSSIIDRKVRRDDVKVLYIPLTEMASNLGLTAVANMVCIGAYLEYTKIMNYTVVFDAIKKMLKKKKFIEVNTKAVEAGVEFVRENYSKK
jgi:Pyruvate/2-oxoacid:ferredoxin oxidoreductase gamma subunit